MNNITFLETQNNNKNTAAVPEEKIGFWDRYDIFLIAILATELFTPYLIWIGILPGILRWITDLALLAIIGLTLIRMLLLDKIPPVVLVILGITIVGTIVAFFEGQALPATIWGWWVMFRYPIIGIYAYLKPHWPINFSARLLKALVWLLGFEVSFQIIQYLAGEPPGDHLAGTFGGFGTASLLMLLMLTFSLALGQWLANGDWRMLGWVVLFCTISSTLGEMKIFPFVVVILAVLALCIHLIRGQQMQRLILFVLIFLVIVIAFVAMFNLVVAEQVEGVRRLEDYLFDANNLNTYLFSKQLSTTGSYFGRGFALQYGWQILQRDGPTFLFGMGLGARGESRALGIVGEGLRQGNFGLYSGTSLLVMMQEIGAVGLFIFGFFMLWFISRVYQDAKRDPGSADTVVRYGMIMFSVLWPIWLWYEAIWASSIPMLLYWGLMGYILSRPLPAPANKYPPAYARKNQKTNVYLS
ncbi:MAG: hypothetical protein KDE48_13540 [Anaerolineales bacterium]|nr:hypothetical protein [Anaerolineales bacterium]